LQVSEIFFEEEQLEKCYEIKATSIYTIFKIDVNFLKGLSNLKFTELHSIV